MASTETLTVDDFADLFGTSVDELPPACVQLIKDGDWQYTTLGKDDRDSVVVDFMDRLEKREFSIVIQGDKARWVRGWAENLDDFKKSKGTVEALAPKYIRQGVPMRLRGDFVREAAPGFELRWYKVFQEWLFTTYFGPYDTIFEFGCGSGINVARLAQMFPDKKIIGLDWAEPSCNIVEEMRRIHGWNVEGRLFDFFNPDASLEVPPNSAVLTVGALEQTGTAHPPFIDFLLAKRPELCVFVEPTYDWYDPSSLVDLLAIRAHELRNFWRGFQTRLDSLQALGQAEIIKRKRSFFGSLVLEGYSQTIWRPTRR